MQVLKVNAESPERESIRKVAEILKVGGVIVYPTETVYGLGANILDQQAVQRVFEIKGRDISKPVSAAFRNLSQAKNFALFNKIAENLAEKFLPGPLTIILQSKILLDPFLGGQKIAIRIIDHPVVSAVLDEVKFPITATSANIAGGKNPVTAEDAVSQIGSKVDLILDAGKCKLGKTSTVVDCSSGEIEILREGVIPKKRILEFSKISP